MSVNGLKIESVSLPPSILPAWSRAKKLVKQIEPDWIIGFSDSWYGIMAQRLAQRCKARVLIDAYDNFEAYIPAALPLHWLWRKALSKADVITCAGPSLANLLGSHSNAAKVKVIPMTADKEVCVSMKKAECRTKLGLQQTVKLIGCHGSLYQSRGIDVFFQAAESIHEQYPDIVFVTSGRVDGRTTVPDFFHHLGYLSDDDVPYLLNSLDVLVVPNKADRFGNYSYPVKIYEGMNYKLPMVVTRTESTEYMLHSFPDMLVEPDDVEDMKNGILRAIDQQQQSFPPLPSWHDNALAMQALLLHS